MNDLTMATPRPDVMTAHWPLTAPYLASVCSEVCVNSPQIFTSHHPDQADTLDSGVTTITEIEYSRTVTRLGRQ